MAKLMFNSRVILFFLLFFAILGACKSNKKTSQKNINSVVKDSLVVMNENGVLESIDAQSVKAPQRWNVEYRIIYLVPEGNFVHLGDTLVKFDPTPILDKLEQAKAALDISGEKLKEIQEENALNLKDKLAAIYSLRMQYQIDSTKAANAGYESETQKQDLKLELEKSKLDLARAFKNLEAQKMINKTRKRLNLIKIQQARINLQRIRNMLNEMDLMAEHSGIVVYRHSRSNAQALREGETVFPGQLILRVANLNKMKATLNINEVDREWIKQGQKVRLVVNAYPDSVFEGKIGEIAKIAELVNDDGTVKAYETDVYLNSGENYRLKPGLSARAEIIIDTLNNVFKIPQWCLKSRKGQWMVQNTNGKMFFVHPIRLNDGFVFVKGNLKDGMALKAD